MLCSLLADLLSQGNNRSPGSLDRIFSHWPKMNAASFLSLLHDVPWKEWVKNRQATVQYCADGECGFLVNCEW